jgi:hypothetical protein
VLCAVQIKSSRPDVYTTIGTTGGGVVDDEEAVVLDLPATPRQM